MKTSIINDNSGGKERGSNSLSGYDHSRFSNDRRYTELVREAKAYHDNMRALRLKWKRDIDYYMGGENGGYPPTKNGDIRSLLCA